MSYKRYEQKPNIAPIDTPGPLSLLLRRIQKWRRDRVTLTLLLSPNRPAHPVRVSVFSFFVLVLASIIAVCSLLSMALRYQVKAIALNEQRRLAQSLMAERDSLKAELNQQEHHMVDLTLQLKDLQTELAEVHAVRKQILEVLPESISNAISSAPAGETAVLPAGGAETYDQLSAWVEGTLARSQAETTQLLQSMRDTYRHAVMYRRRLNHTPSIWPAEGWISSEYGSRIHPITGARSMHNGIDIAAPVGTPIVAAADGVVKLAGEHGGYGLTVIIDHDYGIETLYAHTSEVLVRVGQHVRRGQLIARVGSTGLSTGPHLHYEIRRNSRHINPREMLP